MDSTVGQATSDSYVSVAEADTFVAACVDRSAWPTVDLDKEAALIEATRIIDESFEWVGSIATTTQALRWPRLNAADRDGRIYSESIVPKAVKDAVCNLAYYLVKNGGLTVAANDVKKIKVGPIDLQMNDNNSTIGIPRYVVKSLAFLGSFVGASSGSVYSGNVLRS